MQPPRSFAALLLALLVAMLTIADEKKDEGFVPLFNRKDLTGWVNVNGAPGTFFVKDGEIITTGKPTGFLRTAKQYENFILEMEWLHVNKKEVGNSGLFVWGDPLPAVGSPYTRGIEVQVLVNLEKEGYYTSHGDVFSIWGATCKPDRPHPNGWARCLPSERRCKGGGEWNHYRIEAKDGVIKLHVNGKEVSGVSECKPRKGYLALESEGAECHFRNIRIKELPSSNPKPDEIADEAKGFRSLFTGLDLSGWKTSSDAAKKDWQPRDWILHFDGKSDAKDRRLRTEQEYEDAEFIVDFRFPAKKGVNPSPCEFLLREGKDGTMKVAVAPGEKGSIGIWILAPDGTIKELQLAENAGKGLKPAGQWNRLHSTLQGKSVQVFLNGVLVYGFDKILVPANGTIGLAPQGEMDFANALVRPLSK